jgi:hypothetical protein
MAHKYALNLLVAENDLQSTSLSYGHSDYSYPVRALGWFLISPYLLEWKLFQTEAVEKNEMYILCPLHFFHKTYSFEVIKQKELWRVSSSGIWCRVVCWVATDVSEEHIASLFRVEEIFSACHLLTCWFLLKLFLRPWSWRRYIPSKRRLQLNRLHSIISQKMILFITTAVKTSNPTKTVFVLWHIHPWLKSMKDLCNVKKLYPILFYNLSKLK